MARTNDERLNTCAQCKNAIRDFYEVTRHERGEKVGWVRLCSLLCLMNWAPKHGMRRVQSAFVHIAGALTKGRK